jgi:monoamine oxidase
MTDDEVIASAMKAVKAMFPQAPNTYKSYIRTNWLMDPYTKMSYTFIARNSSPEDMNILAESIGNNRIHFAGEHTNFEFIACTHSALTSGVISFEKILG